MNLFFLGCLMRKRLYWKPDWNWSSWIRKHGIKSAPQFKLQAWPHGVLEKVKPIEQDWIFEVYCFEIFPSITLYFEPPWLPYLAFKVIISRNIKSEIFCIMIFLVQLNFSGKNNSYKCYYLSYSCIPDRRWWILKSG